MTWHRCDDSCYFWAEGADGDYCNYESGPAQDAETGRPGCSRWLCSHCGYAWDDCQHDKCMTIEVELDI